MLTAIFFGSEIKYIFQMTQKKFHINTYFLKNFLINGYKCLNKIEGNFFRDIREIKSGSIKKLVCQNFPKNLNIGIQF